MKRTRKMIGSFDLSKNLHLAAESGQLEIAKELLKVGVTIDVVDSLNRTPLHDAALNGHIGIVKFLIGKGAKANSQDQSKRSPLHDAASNGHIGIVKFLIENEADIHLKDVKEKTPMDLAANNGHTEVVAFLSERVKIKDASSLFETAFIVAASTGKTKAGIYYLDKKGVDVNVTDENGYNALHKASMKGYTKFVTELLARGAYVNATDNYGCTALQWAARYGHTETADALLKNGTDLDIVCNRDFTALSLAKHYNRTKTVSFLEGFMAKKDKGSSTSNEKYDLLTVPSSCESERDTSNIQGRPTRVVSSKKVKRKTGRNKV